MFEACVRGRSGGFYTKNELVTEFENESDLDTYDRMALGNFFSFFFFNSFSKRCRGRECGIENSNDDGF